MSKRAIELTTKAMQRRIKSKELLDSLVGDHSRTANRLLAEVAAGREINANERYFLARFIELFNYIKPKRAATDERGTAIPQSITVINYSDIPKK